MNEKVLRRAINVSWIILIACFVIKAFGGNWFEVMVDNPKVLAAGKYISERAWLAIPISTCTSYILSNLYYLAICQKSSFKWYIHLALVPYFVGITTAKYYIPKQYGLLLDLVTLIVIPYILLATPPYKNFFQK